MSMHSPLALLLLIPLALLLTMGSRHRERALPYPAAAACSGLPVTLRQRAARLLPALRLLALFIAVIALTRPQLLNSETTLVSKGVDIVLALDLSTSMLAIDQRASRSRLENAKEVAGEFIARRSGDRIGLIAFAARPYPAAPLTLDHDWLKRVLAGLDTGRIEDGTALGDSLIAGLNRLRRSPADSRVLVVITDGRTNTGAVTPRDAAEAARTLGVRIHAIGIGGKGMARLPVGDPLLGAPWREIRADLDEAVLQDVAAITEGRYFRAQSSAELRSVFAEIDSLEKRPFEQKSSQNVQELFPPLLVFAVGLALAESALRAFWLRSSP